MESISDGTTPHKSKGLNQRPKTVTLAFKVTVLVTQYPPDREFPLAAFGTTLAKSPKVRGV